MKDVYIDPSATLKETFKKLDDSAAKVLLVVDSEQILLGTITDGDVRRHLLKGGSLEDKIGNVYNPNSVKVDSQDIELIRETLIKHKIDMLPVVNSENRVITSYNWEDVFSERKEAISNKEKLDIPVVIMAGGKGTRMQPFTTVLPKPLIPIGEKTILELLIDNFVEYGINKFYFTLNYRGEMIKAYFNSVKHDYSIEYVWEKDFNGTAGSLSLIDGIDGPFIVSNCDIIVRANYSDIYKFHRESGSILTVVSSIQHHTIPYGVIEYSGGGIVEGIIEKPEYSFPINTGIYFLEKEAIDFIPKNEFFHMTHLIQSLIENGKKVVTYFVNEKDYIDIGQWEEYKKAVEML